MSNNSLVRTDKCCSNASFSVYSFFEMAYKWSLVTCSMLYPVTSHTAEFSLIHRVVSSSEAGKTARLIICVCARRTWSSLHPRFSKNGAICNWRMAWYDNHSAPISRTSLFRILFRSISWRSLPFRDAFFSFFSTNTSMRFSATIRL